MTFSYEYPRPAATADIIVVHQITVPQVLLIQRKNPPYQHMWALPGGFLDENETFEQAAERELREETGLSLARLKQFKTFSTPNRDPRGWTISTVFYGLIENTEHQHIKAGDDAKTTKWFNLNNLPELAFDHKSILNEFIEFHMQ